MIITPYRKATQFPQKLLYMIPSYGRIGEMDQLTTGNQAAFYLKTYLSHMI